MTDPRSPGDCAVLIAGAGPVGLTLAALLHHHGLNCRIIDRAPAPTDKSKALVLWARTMEMLDGLGIAKEFVHAGSFVHAARIYAGKKLLVHLPFDTPGTRYPEPLMLAQCDTERLLTEHLNRVGVRVERPVELADFTDHGDGVTATLKQPDGRAETVRCAWLAGCDGAHSTVRHRLGMEFTGEAEPNDWILADVRLEGPLPDDELSIIWHSKGVLAFFPFAHGRCRVIADLGKARGPSRPPDPTLAEVQAVVEQRGMADVRLHDPVWLAGFRIHERKVSDYRRGRVFLAGDAAHIHSPAGGQGMNTGMQDAWNLAWKLALVQSGRAEALLGSYSSERGKVGDEVLHQAGRMTRMALLRNPVARFLRNRVVGILGQIPAFRRNLRSYLTELAIHYPNSPIDGEAPSSGWKSGGIRPGDRVPDVPLREAATGAERWLLEALRGTTHELLLLPAADGDLSRLAEARRRAEATFPGAIRSHLIVPSAAAPPGSDAFGSVLLDPAGSVAKLLGARGEALALVRPDGYLGFRGYPAEWEPLHRHLGRYLIPAAG